jgi:hypothetical protein
MGKLFRKGSRPNGGTKTAAGLKSGLEQKTTAAQLSFKRGFVDKIPLADDDHHRVADSSGKNFRGRKIFILE